jgi:hypothetical protein
MRETNGRDETRGREKRERGERASILVAMTCYPHGDTARADRRSPTSLAIASPRHRKENRQ